MSSKGQQDQEVAALLGYGGSARPPPHRFSETPPMTPSQAERPPHPRPAPPSLFDSPESSPLLQKSQERVGGLAVSNVMAYILGLLGVAPLVTLPSAIAYCGWVGFAVFLFLVAVEVYSAVMLARAWLMLEMFWPRDAVLQRRFPLAAMAEKVGGPHLRRFVALLQNVAVFGASVPFLLLASETLQRLIYDLAGVTWSTCTWLLVTSALLLPFLCLGTPKDLRVVTWLGGSSMVVVTFMTLTSLLLETEGGRDYTPPPLAPSWSSLAYCFGAVAMQFDVHPVILTVQMDMRERHRLPRALTAACAVGAVLILVVSGAAFSIRGSSMAPNLLSDLPGGPVLHVTLGVVVVQVLMCLVLGINTLFQNLEASLNVPEECGWRRACVRAGVVVGVLAVAEAVPHFGPSVELVGGLFATPFIFIFPPIFHALIKYKASGRVAGAREVVVAVNLICLGVVGCVAATVESLREMARLRSSTPSCFVDFTAATPP